MMWHMPHRHGTEAQYRTTCGCGVRQRQYNINGVSCGHHVVESVAWQDFIN